jgi:hypothetical protein
MLNSGRKIPITLHDVKAGGFGGLEVACWPLVPKFAGSNPGENILSTPSFGGELKPSVPCRALRHVKEPKSDMEVATFGKILSAISRP